MSEYVLGDAEVRNAEHPDTFTIPDYDERRTLVVGCYAKLIFMIPEADTPDRLRNAQWSAERMWVRIMAVGAKYIGRLDNHPRYLKGVAFGDLIEFEPRHICALDPANAN